MPSFNPITYFSSLRTQNQVIIFFVILAALALFLLSRIAGSVEPTVVSVSVSPSHEFSKPTTPSIMLVKDLGVKGDAHLGTTVQHRSRQHIKPPPPNLRQVHIMHQEILDEFELQPGDLGENVTIKGLNLLFLGKGTRLRFLEPKSTEEDEKNAPTVVLQGLRNPCPQIEKFKPGLQEKFLERDSDGKIAARKAGVMATVEKGGEIRAGMKILAEMPRGFVRLQVV